MPKRKSAYDLRPRPKRRRYVYKLRPRGKTQDSTFAGKSKVAVAKAAGAALGFIAGDVPGAIMGYQYGGRAAKYALKRKRKFKKSSVISAHNDLTIHSLGSHKFPGNFRIPGLSNPLEYHNVNSWIINKTGITVGQGLQRADWPEAIMTGAWLSDFAFSSSLVGRITLPDSLYQASRPPAASLPGYGTVSINTQLDEKLYIGSVTSALSMLSMVTSPQIVDLYYITPKFDTNDEPIALWDQLMTFEVLGQASAVAPTNVGGTTAVAGGASSNQWGENPFRHAGFRKAWRVLRKQTIVLQPGDQRHLKFNIIYNRIFQKSQFLTNRTETYLRNITVIPFFIVRAGLVGITTAIGTDAESVSYGKVKVGTVHDVKIHLKTVPVQGRPASRIFPGTIINTTNKLQEIDDNDAVKEEKQN